MTLNVVDPDSPPRSTRPRLDAESGFPPVLRHIVGQSGAMKRLLRQVCRVADSDSTIMINGETGSGKGLIAKAIHDLSRRADHPLITINCGAIPEHLLESELFGHVRGAFTGATSPKTGKFEAARGGTIFLDEIGDMSHDLQVKLLRVLEEGEFEPVGGNKTIRADVRVIAATHRDLEAAVEEGRFRQDLFYRLYVIPLELPALRARKTDIPLLIHHFLEHFNEEKDGQIDGVSEEAMDTLVEYAWPGNIRELRNLMERIVVLKGEGIVLTDDLPARMQEIRSLVIPPTIELSEDGICLNTAVTEFEKALILQSLEKANGVKNRAAKLLHLNRTTLVEKIKRHNLT
jgi:sigma-54 dependent transcriptional regulator, flagellar regulatory protein